MSSDALVRRSATVLTLGLVGVFGVSATTLVIAARGLAASRWSSFHLGELACGCEVTAALSRGERTGLLIAAILSSAVLLWFIVAAIRTVLPSIRLTRHLRAGRLPLDARTAALAARHGLAGRTALTREGPAAVTIGWLRPTIILHERLTKRLNAGELSAVLLHEAEHLSRRDPLRLLLTSVAEAVAGPLAPIRALARQIRSGIELRADAASARQMGGAFALSRALTRLLGWRFTVEPEIGAAFNPSEQRLLALLQPGTTVEGRTFFLEIALGLIAVALGFTALLLPSRAAADQQPGFPICQRPPACRLMNASPALQSTAPCAVASDHLVCQIPPSPSSH